MAGAKTEGRVQKLKLGRDKSLLEFYSGAEGEKPSIHKVVGELVKELPGRRQTVEVVAN